MLTDVLQLSSVQRLMGILKSRYGLGLNIQGLINAEELSLDQLDIEKAGTLRGDSYFLQIFDHEKYLATAVMSGASLLTSRDLTAASELVKLVLEPALTSRFLQNQEFQMSNLHFIEQAERKNVIPLKKNYLFEVDAGLKSENQANFPTSLIVLESLNSESISRAASHIHDLTSRWAMVRYSDVSNQIFSISDVKELGPMTIFIENIDTMSSKDLLILAEYSKETLSSQEPIFIIGTSDLQQSIESNKFLESIEFDLVRYKLELDRLPKDFKNLKEAIELFLDRKALLN